MAFGPTDLDRTKLQLEKTANWYNNCVVKLVFQI